jgi:hypothetical protein
MKATTVKVDGELLAKLERTKPPHQSLTGYVRSLLEQAIARRQMAEAADRYAEFVQENGEERSWLAEWDNADLVSPPKRRRR